MSKTDLFGEVLSEEMVSELLKDHTTNKNIIWATDDYGSLGDGFGFFDSIDVSAVQKNIIVPRILKGVENKKKRTKDKAEIFTPAWVCNEMCNLSEEDYIDESFPFNKPTNENGVHDWVSSVEPVRFVNGVTWKDYVSRTTLEITCGEAPYIVSRYDSSTGEIIELNRRIGLLDRKLRVIKENVTSEPMWIEWATTAYKTTYGYEWQGDSLFIARNNLLNTFIDYYRDFTHTNPTEILIKSIIQIITWNIFQMDGLKFVLPMSCNKCEECSRKDKKKSNPLNHNGISSMIMDWENNTEIEFRSLYKNESEF